MRSLVLLYDLRHHRIAGGQAVTHSHRAARQPDRARQPQHPIALICLDIDHFKQINDTSGHAAGDGVLREFARRLHANVRSSDLAVRLGGEEFAMLIEDIDSPNVPRIVARKLIAAMEPEITIDGANLRVTVSIGIGYCHASTDADALMLAADKALYEAKAAGRIPTASPSPKQCRTACVQAGRSADAV